MRICKVCAKLHPVTKRVLKAELPPNNDTEGVGQRRLLSGVYYTSLAAKPQITFPDATTMFSADLTLLSQACLSNCVACVKYPHIAVLFHN